MNFAVAGLNELPVNACDTNLPFKLSRTETPSCDGVPADLSRAAFQPCPSLQTHVKLVYLPFANNIWTMRSMMQALDLDLRRSVSGCSLCMAAINASHTLL